MNNKYISGHKFGKSFIFLNMLITKIIEICS